MLSCLKVEVFNGIRYDVGDAKTRLEFQIRHNLVERIMSVIEYGKTINLLIFGTFSDPSLGIFGISDHVCRI